MYYSNISGYIGVSGFSGAPGISGVSGFSGFTGVSGFSGVSGVSGVSGFSGFINFTNKVTYYSPEISDPVERLKVLAFKYEGLLEYKTCKKCKGVGSTLNILGSRRPCKHCNGNGGHIISTNNKVIEICNACNGVGFISNHFPCDKCNGEGIIDWINQVLVGNGE